MLKNVKKHCLLQKKICTFAKVINKKYKLNNYEKQFNENINYANYGCTNF